LNDAEKASFYEGTKPNIENFMRYCIDRAGLNPHQPIPSFKQSSKILGDLFDLQLVTKAILLSSSSKVRQQILNSQDTMLVNKYRQWAMCKEQLTQYAMIKRNDLLKLGIDIDSLKRATNDLEKNLSLMSIDFAQEYTNVTLPTWQDVQKKLKTDEAAVEIIQIPYKKDTTFYVALIVKPETKNQPEVAFFAQGAEMDNKFLKFYRNAIRYQTADKSTFVRYWQPIAEKLQNVRKVYLSPDGAYHQISLYTLLNPSTEKYLLEEIDITLITNTKDILVEKSTDRISNKTALLMGRPHYSVNQTIAANPQAAQSRGAMREIMRGSAFSDLVGTETEVRYIDSVLQVNQWKTQLCVGSKADENAIKKADSLWHHLSIQSPTILHIATHGFFVNSKDELSDPMLRSGIVLAGINNYLKNGEKLKNEDGILNAQEVMLLNLSHTELVILSACETGLGDIQQGEGVYGLQRALKMAGAKGIMMSLWKVDDAATAQLMSTFYAELMQGKTKVEAFRAAQLYVKSIHKNPMYWGAFVMVGE
jgi:CHAT domain-containing protein